MERDRVLLTAINDNNRGKSNIWSHIRNFGLLWLPPKIFDFLYRFLRWWRVSPYIKNWCFCWLKHQLVMSRDAPSRDVEASYKKDIGKGLVEVRYQNGIRYKTTALGLESVFSERDYFSVSVVAIQPEDIVIDIGAHMGAVSLQLAAKGATVFAYEPNPYNYRVLELNRRINALKTLHCFPFAVSNTIEKSSFKIGKSYQGYLEKAEMSFTKTGGAIEVSTITLPMIFQANKIDHARLIKIDCQGSEYDILFADDVKNVLKKCQNLIVEAHPVETKYNKYELYNYLTNCGFRIKVTSEVTSHSIFHCSNLNYA